MLELVEAAQALADLMCDILEAKKRTNKAGTFYYEDVTLKSWILGPGGRSGNCEDCIENADAGEIEESEFFPADGPDGPVDEPPLHINCFLAGTSVLPGGEIAARTKRWYSGEIVIIRIPGVDDIAVTPNHPILTRRGWLAAGRIELADEVLQCPMPLSSMRLLYPNYDYVETSIEQIAGSALMPGDMTFRGVPVSAEAFHGDSQADAKVDIVWSAGPLTNDLGKRRDAPYRIVNSLLRHRHILRHPLAGDGTLTQLFLAALHASDGIVCGGGSSLSFLGRKSRVHEKLGFADTALLEAEFLPLSQNTSATDADPQRDIQQTLSGQVRFVKPARIFKNNFSGHVYNLQTEDGFYLANTIVTHNCECYVEYRDTRRRVYI